MSDRAHSAEEYVALIDQVIFDLGELRSSSGYDMEELEPYSPALDLLLQEVRDLRQSLADGSYLFGRNELAFMRIVRKFSAQQLPFIELFYRINRTHTQGLDVREG